MPVTHNKKANVLYIKFRHLPAGDSMDIGEEVTALLDEQGHIVGLEILDASEILGQGQLRSVTLKGLAWGKRPLKAGD